MLFPALEAAAAAADNIALLAAGGWESRLLRTAAAVPEVFCCSLGPEDGVTVVEGRVAATGKAAAAHKRAVEKFHLAAWRGDTPAGTLADILFR